MIQHQVEQVTTRAADTAAGFTAGAAGVSWLADVNTWMQIGASAAAILAGLTAAAFHIYKIIELRRLKKQVTEE